ncbi:2OG-Fe(II) oxygenase [Mucilaginibacter sp.]|uniref:2OG-Fe(II) oxygenase n=1 Tax=Mucilaginibacter sp. TaxID=1882438 RepID=UPI0035BC6A2E
MGLQQNVAQADWIGVAESMNANGYALIPNLVNDSTCDESITGYTESGLYRKTITMEHHGYGKGEYKYFSYSLPAVVQQLRESIYPFIAPVANHWMQTLAIDRQYPLTLNELTELCRTNGQLRPTPLILKYETGGYNALHQDLYGDIFFPMQLVVFLNEPGQDYRGGEFVLVEQRPRMQSRAIVLTPRKGDVLLFTTNYRPVQGSRGHYRVNMKHGVSQITQGERYTLGIIFHDAK